MRVSSCFCWIFSFFSRVGSMRMSWTTIEGISHFCPAFFRHSLFSYMHAVARLFALSSRFRFAHIRTILYGCLCKTCAYSHADNFYPRFCHHRIRRALTWYMLMFIFSEVPEYSFLFGIRLQRVLLHTSAANGSKAAGTNPMTMIWWHLEKRNSAADVWNHNTRERKKWEGGNVNRSTTQILKVLVTLRYTHTCITPKNRKKFKSIRVLSRFHPHALDVHLKRETLFATLILFSCSLVRSFIQSVSRISDFFRDTRLCFSASKWDKQIRMLATDIGHGHRSLLTQKAVLVFRSLVLMCLLLLSTSFATFQFRIVRHSLYASILWAQKIGGVLKSWRLFVLFSSLQSETLLNNIIYIGGRKLFYAGFQYARSTFSLWLSLLFCKLVFSHCALVVDSQIHKISSLPSSYISLYLSLCVKWWAISLHGFSLCSPSKAPQNISISQFVFSLCHCFFLLRFHFFCGSSCSLLSRINFDPSKFVKHYNPFGLFDNKALKAVCSNVQSLFSVRLFLYHFIYLKLLWLVFIGALVLLFVIISLVTQVLSFVPTAERTFISRFHCRCATMDVWRSICAHNAKTRFDSVYRSFLSVAHRVS